MNERHKTLILAYLELMRWHSPIGALLLLAPAAWALVIAYQGAPPLKTIIIITLGVWFARSLGCVINDYCDRDFDAQVTRTQLRPLASGRLSVKHAIYTMLFLAAVCSILLIQLPPAAIFAGCIAAALMCIYPLMKRFFVIPQLVLGLAFSMSIVVVFASAETLIWYQLPFSPACWLLYLANCFWTMAYDTQYAMMDLADDKKISIHSSARFFGAWQPLATAVLLTCCTISLLVLDSYVIWRSDVYYAFLIGVGVWFFWLLRQTRCDQIVAYRRVFKQQAMIGLSLAAGMESAYLL